MNLVEATNTGKFNYHLKILGDLIMKNQDGKYGLTEKGQLAAQFLQRFPETESQSKSLRVADSVLIGFVGCVLAAGNPGFWSSFLVALFKVELAVPFFVAFVLLDFVFALVVPGSVMWSLTVRRARSHDAYDLFKPPFVAFILLLLFLIVIFLSGASLAVTIKSPTIDSTWATMQTSLTTILLLGLVLSFPGVLMAEFASRIRKRMLP
jgi:hypothetical protein